MPRLPSTDRSSATRPWAATWQEMDQDMSRFELLMAGLPTPRDCHSVRIVNGVIIVGARDCSFRCVASHPVLHQIADWLPIRWRRPEAGVARALRTSLTRFQCAPPVGAQVVARAASRWQWVPCGSATCRRQAGRNTVPTSSGCHSDHDIVVRDHSAVVCERAQHVGARFVERRLDRPSVVGWNRRRLPSR